MAQYNKKKSFQSKLNVDTLFNKVPMNLKCTLSQNERDFLEAVIHLQHLGRYHTSNSLIMANSGLNSRQISSAKQNLVQMGLIEVADNKSAIGTRYIVKDEVYNSLVQELNAIPTAPERFEYGDMFREKRGLKRLFTNIINTLKRNLASIEVPPDEKLTVSMATNSAEVATTPIAPPPKKSYEEQLAELQADRDNGKITNEQYYKRVKFLKFKRYEK
jgi:hypothetical protein